MVSIEVLRNGLGNADDKVSKIKLNGQNIGECNPDGLDDDCTFFNCDSSLSEKEFSSNSETLTFKLEYVGNSENCSCDTSTWECSSTLESDELDSPTVMSAVARITLTPTTCNIFLDSISTNCFQFIYVFILYRSSLFFNLILNFEIMYFSLQY